MNDLPESIKKKFKKMAQEINNYKFELSYKEINGQSINEKFFDTSRSIYL